MTLWQLKKTIDAAVEKHGKRAKVVIDPKTFSHMMPEVSLFDVCGGVIGLHVEYDGNGSPTNKDGSERLRTYMVLYGTCGQPCCGQLIEHCKCWERGKRA